MEVFVISMNNERYSAAEKNLVGSGFLKAQLVRFPATVGATVDLNDSTIVSPETKSHVLGLSLSPNSSSNGRFIPSKGALGCYLSHYKLWKQIAAEGNDAIIAEDDIVFRVPNASQEIQKKWDAGKKIGLDLLLLGSSKLPLLPSTEPGLFHVMDHFFGTEGYVLSPEGAKRLLDSALPIKVQVDAYIGSFASSKKLKIGAVKPSISGQNHMLVSTVQPQTLKRQTLHSIRKHWLPSILVLILVLVLVAFVIFERSKMRIEIGVPPVGVVKVDTNLAK
jgi:GR25 family glycosyltransferase involved in LPS biosynthesis